VKNIDPTRLPSVAGFVASPMKPAGREGVSAVEEAHDGEHPAVVVEVRRQAQCVVDLRGVAGPPPSR
jgi:hypothetical protein